MARFPSAPAVFFQEPDELRGINRDSRSAKVGMSNAELLATDMNTMARYVQQNNPAVVPLSWGDMLHPLHNGGSVDYQRTYGGRAGQCRCSTAQRSAAPLLHPPPRHLWQARLAFVLARVLARVLVRVCPC